jgi:hypothetical protein
LRGAEGHAEGAKVNARQAGADAARILAHAERSILAAMSLAASKVTAKTQTPQMAARNVRMATTAALGAASTRLAVVYGQAAKNATGQAGTLPDAPGQVSAAILRAQQDAGIAFRAVLAAAGAEGSRVPPPSSPYRRITDKAKRGNKTAPQAAAAALAAIRARGLTGYVSPGGRRQTLAGYGERAVRTATARLARNPVMSQIAARREALLAVHVQAVSAALGTAMARLDTESAVTRFRSDTRVTSTATPEVAKRWRKEAAQAAASSVLGNLGSDPSLLAAISDLITAGLAEGEADAMAVAAQDQGLGSLDIAAAVAAAVARLAGDSTAGQRVRDAASGLAGAVAAAVARVLAGSGQDSTEDEVAEAMRSAASAASGRWTDWALWGAFGAGAVSLWRRAASAFSGAFSQSVLIDWDTDSSPCALCSDNASGSPYAPEDVPSYPGHGNCRCSLSTEASLPSSWLNAFLS